MEKYIRLLFLILLYGAASNTSNVNAQECATEVTQEQQDYMNATRAARDDLYNSLDVEEGVFTVPIQLHIIRNDDGTGGIDNLDVLGELSIVNSAYSSFMRFQQCKLVNYIDSTKYMSFIGLRSTKESELTSNNNVPNVLNIYFAPSVSGCGWATFPADKATRDFIVIENDCATNTSTFAHEIGHYFNLYHTHQGVSTDIGVTADEWVRRGTNQNCGPNVGDELCDTPADPRLSSSIINSSCEYTGNGTDVNGDAYLPDSLNIMSYSRKECRTRFTNQQKERMIKSYIYDRIYLACDCEDYENFSYSLVGSEPNIVREYDTENYISSGSLIYPTAWVLFNAGTEITLRNGFHARSGCEFLAQIEGCTQIETVASRVNNAIARSSQNSSLELTNYPNPFTSRTTISYALEEDNNVSLTVYDLTGKEIATLIDNELQGVGSHTIPFDGSNLGTGIYFYTLQIGDKVQTQKMILTK